LFICEKRFRFKTTKATFMQYDIIVIGAGTAGMPCAIAAAEKGKNVLVIEKSNRVGGTLHLTGGHMSAAGTKHQAAHSINDSVEEHYDDIMRISANTAPADIVRLAVDEAPETIDWLDSLGFEFSADSPRIVYGHVPYQKARTQYGKDAGISIFNVLNPLFEKYVATGKITLKLNHQLNGFIIDNNAVAGVKVVFEYKEIIFEGKKTVLAAGGYAGNATLFAKFHPEHPRLITTASPDSTGEVAEIAMGIGAKFHNANTHISSLGGIEEVPQSGKADFWSAWAMVFTTSYRPPREIYVNALGQRFMDENNPDPDYRERILAKQPEKKFFCVFDEKSLHSEGISIVPRWSIDQIKEKAKEGKCVWVADSIESLAQKMGVPFQNLTQSIEDHNQAVNQNKSNLPTIESLPFYGLLTYATSLISFGGLATNAQLQVINNNQDPIENLYACGEILGAGATTGNAFCGGMLITPAISFGRILGRTL
jgi:succinate dehydrogenase/fumarate reductase flavoprotein subunit